MQKADGEQKMEWMRFCKAVLIGGGIAFGVSVVLLFLCSIGIGGGMLSAEPGRRMTTLVCIAGSFIGGMAALHLGRSGGPCLILGLCTGVVLFLLQMTAGLLLWNTMSPEQGGLGLLLASLCGGGAAGLLEAGRWGKKRPHTRRRVTK